MSTQEIAVAYSRSTPLAEGVTAPTGSGMEAELRVALEAVDQAQERVRGAIRQLLGNYLEKHGIRVGGDVVAKNDRTFKFTRVYVEPAQPMDGSLHLNLTYFGRQIRKDGTPADAEVELWGVKSDASVTAISGMLIVRGDALLPPWESA